MKGTVRFWVMVGVFATAIAAMHFVSSVEAVPAARPLAEFPATLAEWRGIELPLTPSIVKVLGVDDHLNRLYRRADGSPVYFYIGYYHSQRRGKTIHSPKSCLPGAGWYILRSDRIQITQPDGTPAEVNLAVFQKELDRHVVLYWYQSHGRIIANEYFGKVCLVLDAIQVNRTDGALVHLRLPVQENEEETIQAAVQFAQAVLPELDAFIPR